MTLTSQCSLRDDHNLSVLKITGKTAIPVNDLGTCAGHKNLMHAHVYRGVL